MSATEVLAAHRENFGFCHCGWTQHPVTPGGYVAHVVEMLIADGSLVSAEVLVAAEATLADDAREIQWLRSALDYARGVTR